MSGAEIDSRKLPSVEWLNFFVADVQTGLGPFLAAYLAAGGWNPSRASFVSFLSMETKLTTHGREVLLPMERIPKPRVSASY
jgi:hypothetical protein